MAEAVFHHTLAVRQERCKGCTHCMKRCPTGAIRIEGGYARIDGERCIDCGQCMAVCPHNAMVVEQSTFDQLLTYTWRVAIVPAVLFAQFDDQVTERQVCRALMECGFTHLYLSETGVDILQVLKAKNNDYETPLISNFCPAAVRLIQLRYPVLLQNLSLIRTPAQMAAILARAELEAEGCLPEETGIFYITPCAAKIAQIKTEGSTDHAIFQGVLNLDSVYNMIQSLLAKNKKRYEQEASGAWFHFPTFTRTAVQWSLVKGECPMKGERSLAVDEMHNVIDFLEELENEDEVNLDFLELDACAEGCVGGILTIRNRFLATERVRHWSNSLPEKLPAELCERILGFKDILLPQLYTERAKPKSALKLDEDMGKALHKLEKVREIVKVLPGIDCGLCGAPTCKALAEDIAKSNASIRQCVVLKLKNPKELNSLLRIWGERTPSAKD